MKKISRVVAWILSLFILIGDLPAYASEKELPSGTGYSDLEDKIDAYVNEHLQTTAGVAVAVFDEDSEIVQSYYGYADKENQILVDEETVFEWGYASKLLVWVSVMQLYEQGKIELDRDVQAYLPENFLTNLNYDTPITMINLMNHNAGFQEVYADIFVKDSSDFETLEVSLAAHKPEQVYEPGTVTAYSNWSVALAAYVVERVSRMDFSTYVHQNIFEPLQMEHSAISVDLSDNPWVQEKRKSLQCYTAGGDLIPDCFYYITLYPAGMCTSTLTDFETFARALLHEDTILFQKEETWKELFTPSMYFDGTEIPRNHHGFWMIPLAVQTVGHGGNTAGCSSYLLIQLDSKTGAVVMTNQSQESIYTEKMMELIWGEYNRGIYVKESETSPDGIFRVARTVRKGPLKVMSLSYEIEEFDKGEFWILNNGNGTQQIEYAYRDYLEVPLYEFILEMSLFVLWVFFVLFTLVSLLERSVRYIVLKFRRKAGNPLVLGRWSLVASALQIIVLINLLGAIVNVSTYELSSSYQWMFAGFGILLLIIIGMIAFGIIKMVHIKPSKKLKIYNWFVMAGMIVTVVNICYWNLFMFWKI